MFLDKLACVFHARVCSTDQSAVPVLQEQSQKEAGLGEDAAALFGDLITGLLSVSLQQVQQNFHRAFHRVHRLNGLVVLLTGHKVGKKEVKLVQFLYLSRTEASTLPEFN